MGHQELIALGGLLAQISGALLALTDQLSAPTHRYDRIQQRRARTDASGEPEPVAASSTLQNCRDGLRTTYAAALAVPHRPHAALLHGALMTPAAPVGWPGALSEAFPHCLGQRGALHPDGL
ncbi:MAG: hypothetical protein JO272_13400 [Pseudonocardiales bacterium]|nr:hypothetical protein [Pseudonocardiales bacterium]